MNDLFDLPQIDEDGYFCGMCTCMNDPITGEALCPPDVVNIETPKNPELFWYKFNGSTWTLESKPTTCEECIKFNPVSHSSGSTRSIELRDIFQRLVNQDLEHYQVSLDENGDWVMEARPEKSEEEQKNAKIAEYKHKLEDTDYITIKLAEGVITKEECSEILEQRAMWRALINELESK